MTAHGATQVTGSVSVLVRTRLMFLIPLEETSLQVLVSGSKQDLQQHVLRLPVLSLSCNQLTLYVGFHVKYACSFHVYLIMKFNFAHLFLMFLLNKSD